MPRIHFCEGQGLSAAAFFILFTASAWTRFIHWLNAGHEPAIIYDPDADSFEELHGGGNLPLGISEDSQFREAITAIAPGQSIVIATDGIREAQNRHGNMFGKEAFEKIIRQNAAAGATEILKAVFTAVDLFQYGNKIDDDMTLMVVKVMDNS